MDDTRSDDLIRRNHELLAAAAKAWSDFMETAARIDRERAGEDVPCALVRVAEGWPAPLAPMHDQVVGWHSRRVSG